MKNQTWFYVLVFFLVFCGGVNFLYASELEDGSGWVCEAAAIVITQGHVEQNNAKQWGFYLTGAIDDVMEELNSVWCMKRWQYIKKNSKSDDVLEHDEWESNSLNPQYICRYSCED
ncbi:MAG: hypothetical protein R3A45_00440 [Bdellovibrionota bacterium]